jgi:hypothetical protein
MLRAVFENFQQKGIENIGNIFVKQRPTGPLRGCISAQPRISKELNWNECKSNAHSLPKSIFFQTELTSRVLLNLEK